MNYRNFIHECKKAVQENKVCQILLEASQIEVILLSEELEKVKMQLNSVRKSSRHSSIQSNKTTLY